MPTPSLCPWAGEPRRRGGCSERALPEVIIQLISKPHFSFPAKHVYTLLLLWSLRDKPFGNFGQRLPGQSQPAGQGPLPRGSLPGTMAGLGAQLAWTAACSTRLRSPSRPRGRVLGWGWCLGKSGEADADGRPKRPSNLRKMKENGRKLLDCTHEFAATDSRGTFLKTETTTQNKKGLRGFQKILRL